MKTVHYPMTLRDRLRYRFGLTWLRHIPTLREIGAAIHLDSHDAAILLLLGCAYALVGSMDYADQQLREAERQAQLADAAHAILAACMNGEARWTTDNISGKGYGKTAIVCRGVEEIPL